MLSKLEYNAGKDLTNDIEESLNNTKAELQTEDIAICNKQYIRIKTTSACIK